MKTRFVATILASMLLAGAGFAQSPPVSTAGADRDAVEPAALAPPPAPATKQVKNAATLAPAEPVAAPYADDQFEQLDATAITAWWQRYGESRHEADGSSRAVAARPDLPRTRR